MSTPAQVRDDSVPQPHAEPVAPEPHSAELLAAIRSGDAEAMGVAWQQINQLERPAAVAAIEALKTAKLGDPLLSALLARSQSVNTAEAWTQTAEVAFAFESEAIATRAATETLQREPRALSATFILAVYANRAGKPDQASNRIKALIALVPEAKNDPNLTVQLAIALLGQKNAPEALAILDESLERLVSRGVGFDAQVLRGRALLMLDRSKEALEAWEVALTIATPPQAV